MKPKDIESRMVRETKMHKLGKIGYEERGYISSTHHTFFVMSLTVICFMLLFAGISVANAATVYVATDGSGGYNCDGTDDHIEINEAIDYINSIGGGTVHLKSGTYIINDLILMKSSVTLEGEGSSSTIIKLMDNCTYPAEPASKEHMILLICSGPGMPRYPPEITNITIQNLQVDANKRGNPTHIPHSGIFSRCIHIRSTYSTYRNILIRDMSNDGIGLPGGHHNDIIDCWGELIGHDAIRSADNTYSNIVNFTAGWGGEEGRPGNNIIRLTNCQHCTLDNISGSGGDNAIQLTTAGSGHCAHNIIKNSNLTTDTSSAWHGVVLYELDSGSTYDNTIENTVIGDTYSDGIGIYDGASNTKIINCVIYKSGHGWRERSGIKVYAGSGTVVKNTIIVNSGGYGIDGDVVSTYNDIWNNALGNYSSASAGTGDISMDPLFADHLNDFHLKSEYGRLDGTDWVQDNETSSCIGAGDLNGEKINMGAYGNTAEASLASNETRIYPTITQYSPTGTAVPVETTINVTFSKAMNATSAEGAFSISPDVSGTFSWIGTEMISTPDSNLDYETTYTVTLTTEAEDLDGNNLPSTFNWQFTTIASGMDLVAEWHFNEGIGVSVEDTSVNTNNGTLVNMDVTAWVPGKNGTALQFDGVDDYVDCGNDASLDITDAITIETWLNPNIAGEGVSNAGPVCKAEAEVDWSWQLRYNAPGGYMGFQFNGDPEGSTWVSVNQNLTPGEWYHIAGTFDGTTLRCYLNGVETDTNILSAIKSGNATLFIGQDGWGNIFNGVVDELKLYNRALTTEEIQADYEAGLNSTANTLSGTVTSPCGTDIPNATVTLTTRSGAEINTTQTDSTGHYAFANVSPDYYDITATKRSYWSNTNNVTVTAEAPETADIVLCQKGDFNTNSEPADAGDLAMMADATAVGTSDVTYDLDGDGNPADEDDLTLLKEVSVGVTELE